MPLLRIIYLKKRGNQLCYKFTGKYANAIVYTVKNEEYAIEDYARAQVQRI